MTSGVLIRADRVPGPDLSWLVAELEGELRGQVQAHVELPVTSAAFQLRRPFNFSGTSARRAWWWTRWR